MPGDHGVPCHAARRCRVGRSLHERGEMLMRHQARNKQLGVRYLVFQTVPHRNRRAACKSLKALKLLLLKPSMSVIVENVEI